MRALTALGFTAALSAQTAAKHTFEVSVIGPTLKGENSRALRRSAPAEVA